MIPGVQPKLEASIKDGKLILEEPIHNWKLVREKDGLTKHSSKITWLTWSPIDNSCTGMSDDIQIGKSLLMSPFNDFFTWQTTTVTEIVEQREDYIKFKTENSNYELFKI